ncbi:MAG: FAD-binding protein [Rhodothermales bacterium]|nr:FAD-binding protein [Rhodothermales bacterium]
MPTRRDILQALAAGALLPGCLPARPRPAPSSTVVITPGDPRYAGLVRGNNPRFEAAPRAFHLCADAEGVAHAVEAGLRTPSRKITVRSGGHCYENFVCDNQGGVLIDVSALKTIRRETDGTYRVDAGCTIGDAYTQLYALGVFLPLGTCFSVGLGGHITGGGFGVWSRPYGLSVDYLQAIELVHVDERGQVVARKYSLDDPADREVVWAHQGGGGGNFGIVTSFWFKDPPGAPPTVYQAGLSWEWATLTRRHYGQILRAFGDFLDEHNQPDSPFDGLYTSLGLGHRTAGETIGVGALYVGDEPERIEAFFDYMRARVDLPGDCQRQEGAASCISSAPWFQVVASQAGGTNREDRMKYKSAYYKQTFPDRQIDVLYRYLVEQPAFPADWFTIIVGSYGGAVNRRASFDTAASQREAIMKLQFIAGWRDPTRDAACIQWLGEFYRELYADAGGEPTPNEVYDGCYVNYPDVDLVDWPHLYYKNNYPTLTRVKRRLDPLNVFRHAQSVRVA